MKSMFIIFLCFFWLVSQGQITNQAVSVEGTGVICENGNGYLSTSSSQIGISYYLRDDSNDSILIGPVYGTGNKLVFNPQNINSTTTYNVYAEQSKLAIRLNTSNDYVHGGFSTRNINNQVTISAWVKTTSNTPGLIALKGSSGLRLNMDASGKVNFLANTASTGLSTTSINDGQWHFITAVYGASLCKLYIDGVLEKSASTNNSTLSNSSPLYVGATTSLSSLVGEIDEFSILNTAANDSTIQAIMNNCLTGNELDLVAYFKFDDFGSTIIKDYSLMAIDASLIYVQLISDDYVTSPKGCISYTPLEMTPTVTITVTSPLANEVVSILEDSVCIGNSTMVSLGSSVSGASYFLKDENNNLISGPIVGTGSSINFNTGSIDTATIYNVYSEIPSSMGSDNALSFDGVNSVVSTGYSMSSLPLGATEFTFEAWLNVAPNNGDVIFQVNDWNGNLTIGEMMLMTSGASYDGLNFHIGNSFILTAPNVLVFNTWQHVAVTFNSGIVRMYINGVQVALGSAPVNNLASSSIPLTLGGGNSFFGYYTGKMDNVRLWTLARTSSDLLSSMNNCDLGILNGLVRFYPFRETPGTDPLDWANGEKSTSSGFTAVSWVPSGISCSPQCELQMTQMVDVDVKTMDNTTTLSGTTLSSNQAGAIYQWLDCNNNNTPIANETGQSFTPSGNGDYAVEITFNNCTDTSVCENVTGVGINNIATLQTEIYPNPVDKELTIITTETINQVLVYNSNGAVIKMINNSIKTINVADLSQGMYILVLKSDKGISQTRFVKM